MISNLRSQLAAMMLEHRLPQILEEAERVRHDLGYPIVVSPFAQYIVTQATINVVQGERYRTIPDEIRKYASGYYGKLAAPLSADFLNRFDAKEKPASARPGEHIEPGLPRLRAELGPGASDEDLLLAAFYDRKLLEPLKKPQPEYQYRTSPLEELVAWLGARRDIAHARIRFAGTEMTFSA
jgi:oxaloacetate decarboxylase alpha subunit